MVTKKTATDNGLTSIGDLSKIVPFKLGSNPQFGELGYGIPGLKSVYGVGTKAGDVTFVPIEDFGGPDTVKALVDDSVQVADIYTTSPGPGGRGPRRARGPEEHDLVAEHRAAGRRRRPTPTSSRETLERRLRRSSPPTT